MLHPRLTPIGGTLGGSSSAWLASVGPYGAWSDLTITTRWGQGASGMYEATWQMALPAGFSHPLLRRSTQVEAMDGPYRMGSSLIMAEPGVGTGLGDPWTLTATGVGREVEGESAFYALDSSGNTTTIATTAVDNAITRPGGILGWPIAGRDASIPASGPSASSTSDGLQTVGALLGAVADESNARWGVGQDNKVALWSDPTTPTYHVVPGAAQLGTADDDYATVVLFRYLDNVTHTFATAVSPSSPSAVETRFGRREVPVDRTDLGAVVEAPCDEITTVCGGRFDGEGNWKGAVDTIATKFERTRKGPLTRRKLLHTKELQTTSGGLLRCLTRKNPGAKVAPGQVVNRSLPAF